MQLANGSKASNRHMATERELGSQLRLLATIEPSDADFISCYLNLSDGQAACEALLQRRAEEIRHGLEGVVRVDFEHALEMVSAELAQIWRGSDADRCPAVALFARGLAGGQSLSVVRLDVPVEPAVVFYRVPELTPLALAGGEQPPFTLVLARQGSLQVLDVQGAKVTPRAWSTFRENPRAATARGEILLPQRRFQMLRRALIGPSATPLVVAGDGPMLDEVTAALPARATGRLRDVMRIPSHLSQAAAIERIRRRFSQRLRLQDHQLAARLVRAVRSRGLAVAGPMACREALRADAVEALMIAQDHRFSTIWGCDACEALTVSEQPPATCDRCDCASPYRWRVVTELVRLACQQGVAVIRTSDDQVSYLGGVGCLLREPVETAAMPCPDQARQTLELVA